jgi:hypothetical protein
MNLSNIVLLLLALATGIITILDIILILSRKRGKKDEDK